MPTESPTKDSADVSSEVLDESHREPDNNHSQIQISSASESDTQTKGLDHSAKGHNINHLENMFESQPLDSLPESKGKDILPKKLNFQNKGIADITKLDSAAAPISELVASNNSASGTTRNAGSDHDLKKDREIVDSQQTESKDFTSGVQQETEALEENINYNSDLNLHDHQSNIDEVQDHNNDNDNVDEDSMDEGDFVFEDLQSTQKRSQRSNLSESLQHQHHQYLNSEEQVDEDEDAQHSDDSADEDDFVFEKSTPQQNNTNEFHPHKGATSVTSNESTSVASHDQAQSESHLDTITDQLVKSSIGSEAKQLDDITLQDLNLKDTNVQEDSIKSEQAVSEPITSEKPASEQPVSETTISEQISSEQPKPKPLSSPKQAKGKNYKKKPLATSPVKGKSSDDFDKENNQAMPASDTAEIPKEVDISVFKEPSVLKDIDETVEVNPFAEPLVNSSDFSVGVLPESEPITENPWDSASQLPETTSIEKMDTDTPASQTSKAPRVNSIINRFNNKQEHKDNKGKIPSPKLKPFIQTQSPQSVPLFSPKFGKPRSVSSGSRRASSLLGNAPALDRSPTLSPTDSHNDKSSPRPQSILQSVQQKRFLSRNSPTAATYSPSLGSPISPTTRERRTEEIKKIYHSRGPKSVVLNDLPLPFHPVNKTKFHNTPKFDASKSIIYAVCLCDFNHARGPEIEYWIDENGAIDLNESPKALEQLSKKWPTLPFQALPDGSHEFEETFSNFNILLDESDGSTLNTICDIGSYKSLESYDANTRISSAEMDKHIKEKQFESPLEKDLVSFNENVTTLWAISCIRQIATEELVEKSSSVTRTSVQKSIVIIARQPIFGQLKEKLSIITKSLFLQKNFTDKSILSILYENLVSLYSPDKELVKQQQQLQESEKLSNNFNGGINSILRENDFYVGLSLKEFIHSFRRNALVIFKSILLEKKILFFSKNIEKLCNVQLSLITLIPNLITNLNDCGSPYLNFNEFNLLKSLNLKTSNRYSLLTFLGLPLQIFGFDGIFNPYTPLQQLDDITKKDKIKHYIIGTSNDLLLGQKEKYCDLLINLDNCNIEFVNKELAPVLSLSSQDKKFIDLVIKNVEHFYYNGPQATDGEIEEAETSFNGSEDYIRLSFEDYLLGLLSSVKYDKFLNKLGYKTTFPNKNQNKSPQRNIVVNQSMLVPGVDLDNISNFNIKFIEEWIYTANYKTFDRFTDNEIFYIFDPLHFAMSGNFANQQEEFEKNYNKNNFIEGFNYFKANVQNKLQNNSLIARNSNSQVSGTTTNSNSSIQQTASNTTLSTPNQGNIDSNSVHSFSSADNKNSNKTMKYTTLESGSFSLDDLTILNSINDEIEMNNPMAKDKGSSSNTPSSNTPKSSWISSWSSWVKR